MQKSRGRLAGTLSKRASMRRKVQAGQSVLSIRKALALQTAGVCLSRNQEPAPNTRLSSPPGE